MNIFLILPLLRPSSNQVRKMEGRDEEGDCNLDLFRSTDLFPPEQICTSPAKKWGYCSQNVLPALKDSFPLRTKTRARHFLTKVKKSTGTVWISFTNTSSSTKKKKLGLYLISKPNRKKYHILPQNTKEKWHFQFFWFSYIKIMSKIIFDFTYQNVWSRRLIWYPYCHTFVTFHDRHKCHNMT